MDLAVEVLGLTCSWRGVESEARPSFEKGFMKDRELFYFYELSMEQSHPHPFRLRALNSHQNAYPVKSGWWWWWWGNPSIARRSEIHEKMGLRRERMLVEAVCISSMSWLPAGRRQDEGARSYVE